MPRFLCGEFENYMVWVGLFWEVGPISLQIILCMCTHTPHINITTYIYIYIYIYILTSQVNQIWSHLILPNTFAHINYLCSATIKVPNSISLGTNQTFTLTLVIL